MSNKLVNMIKIALMPAIIVIASSDFTYAKVIYKKHINGESIDIYAKNNEILDLILSEKEINRISFEGEKVKGLHYTDGEMEFSIEEGDLYIKIKTEKPVNFFIKMESGRTYQMLVITSDTPSAQYFIKKGGGKSRVESSNKAKPQKAGIKPLNSLSINNKRIEIRVKKELNSYEGEINKILSVAETGKKYMGYELKKQNKKIYLRTKYNGVREVTEDNRRIKEIEGKEVLSVKGKGLIGYKIEILNNNQEGRKIKAEYFEGSYENVVATYVEKEMLGAKEKTNLYIVRKL